MSELRRKIKASAKKNQSGVTLVLVAIMMVVLIGFIALAIDIGYSMVTLNELQNISDGAALAACRELGGIYRSMSQEAQRDYLCDEKCQSSIIATAVDVGQNNRAGGLQPIVINDVDVIIGDWDPVTETFTPTLERPDAVRVIARRDGNANNPIPTFFARVLGIDAIAVRKDAIAALTSPAKVEPGELKTPFGLSMHVFPNDCKDEIIFSPTTESCAGWHNFIYKANASSLDDVMIGIIRGHTSCDDCSGLTLGDTWLNASFDIKNPPDSIETPGFANYDDPDYESAVNFIGGNVSSLFLGGVLDADYNGNTGTILGNEKKPAPFPALFDYFRYRDGDGDNSVWSSVVPVYSDGENCNNPSGLISIVGFANIIIRMPNPPPDSSVSVTVDCNQFIVDGRGGGGEPFGNLKGAIPNLVQ